MVIPGVVEVITRVVEAISVVGLVVCGVVEVVVVRVIEIITRAVVVASMVGVVAS